MVVSSKLLNETTELMIDKEINNTLLIYEINLSISLLVDL